MIKVFVGLPFGRDDYPPRVDPNVVEESMSLPGGAGKYVPLRRFARVTAGMETSHMVHGIQARGREMPVYTR